jgi:hypothetical protein
VVRSPPSADPTADALFASGLAHAWTRSQPSKTLPRVGRIGLVDEPLVEPDWTEPRDLAWTRSQVSRVVPRLVALQRGPLAARVSLSVCTATNCPYLRSCYPMSVDVTTRRKSPQTSFEFLRPTARRKPRS